MLTNFHDFGLAEPIVRALAGEDYTTPTPIQTQTIPFVLAGRDVVGIAQTGTGKTAAFAVPILNRLSSTPQAPERKRCRVLVLAPTRELAGQIAESFETYGRHLRCRVALAIGGLPIGRQMRALAPGVDVLVGTPGRILDLLQQRALHFDKVEVLVLDEADRMLDMGFIHDIRTIVSRLPKQRQALLFSATMPGPIAELADQMLRDPAKVTVTPAATTVERIEQSVIHVDRGDKPALLSKLLRENGIERALIFTRTKHGADKVVRGLVKSGIAAEAIHGNKSQNQRERILGAFRDGSLRTLVATDIASRGIDVTGISHVINYDLPNEPESYVHRIGRTARAGAAGTAISFCAADERAFLRAIEKIIRMSLPASGESATHHEPRGKRPAAPSPSRTHQKPYRGSRPQHAQAPAKKRQDQGQEQRGAQDLSGLAFLRPARPALDRRDPSRQRKSGTGGGRHG